MNPLRPLALCALLASAALAQSNPATTQSPYPKGAVTQHTFSASQIFPGTTRDYWLYIPKQYDPTKPACLYVNQDAVQFNAPAVFDRLIAEGSMPVTVAVFVRHGRVPASQPDRALDRFNRSLEYDGLGDAYARFLLDEFLPYVEKTHNLNLSKDPNDRAIGGSSSGAICAFTAAWERPDAFRRVFSSIGTYVGLRGGNAYVDLIRKVEPKPLRVFLEDGSNDNNHYGGDWWMQNQTMERALTFAGYEVNHAWGDGGHNGKHATEIFPDAMRWLWKDWPKPVAAGKGSEKLQEILLPGEGWQPLDQTFQRLDGAAVNSAGEVFFSDQRAGKTYRVSPDGLLSTFLPDNQKSGGQAFGPDGNLYSTSGTSPDLLITTPDGRTQPVPLGFKANDLVVAHNGNIYLTESPDSSNPKSTSKLWLLKPGTPDANPGLTWKYEKRLLAEGTLKFANGITLSPDQTLLYVADYRSRWVYSYQIQPDGSLAFGQRYHHLYVPDDADDSGADGIRTDRDGRLYVSSRMGIQICDQAGRVQCIIPTPNHKIANLTFGGPNFDTLYAMSADRVFKRKLKTQGANPWAPPLKPAAPKL